MGVFSDITRELDEKPVPKKGVFKSIVDEGLKKPLPQVNASDAAGMPDQSMGGLASGLANHFFNKPTVFDKLANREPDPIMQPTVFRSIEEEKVFKQQEENRRIRKEKEKQSEEALNKLRPAEVRSLKRPVNIPEKIARSAASGFAGTGMGAMRIATDVANNQPIPNAIRAIAKTGVLGETAKNIAEYDSSEFFNAATKRAEDFADVPLQNETEFRKHITNAGTSIVSNAPALLANFVIPGAGLPFMGGQVGLGEYNKGVTSGLNISDAAMRALGMTGFEVLGEKVGGFNKLGGGLNKAISAKSLFPLGEGMVKSGLRETPGELLTSLGQYAIDASPIGTNPNSSLSGLGEDLKDTAIATLMQTGAMVGGGHAIKKATHSDYMKKRELARELSGTIDNSNFAYTADEVARNRLSPANAQIIEGQKAALVAQEQTQPKAHEIVKQETQAKRVVEQTGKPQSMFDAINDMGGVSSQELQSTLGLSQEQINALPDGLVREDGLSINEATAKLSELGYIQDQDFSDLFDLERRGSKHYTPEGYSQVYADNENQSEHEKEGVGGGGGDDDGSSSIDSTNENIVLQNRDRSTPQSIAQVNSIAANPDYGRVSISRDFANGAPVVVNDGAKVALGKESYAVDANGKRIPVQYAVVESDNILASNDANGNINKEYGVGRSGSVRAIAGNGRAAGIAEAYRRGTASQYRTEMSQDVDHGVSHEAITGFKNPVLVRVMPASQVTHNIGDVSNTSNTAMLSPLEQARNDAKRIDLGAIQYGDNGINHQNVIDFVRGMPVSEQVGLLGKDGQVTRQAEDRLMAAIFHQAYENDDLVELYVQATDPESRSVLNGLAMAAHKMVQLKDSGQFDIREIVTEAAQAAVNAARRGEKLSDYGKTRDIDRSQESDVIVSFLADNIRSAKRIGEGLSDLADMMQNGHSSQDSMFGDAITREQALDSFRNKYAQETNGRNKSGIENSRRSINDLERSEQKTAERERQRGVEENRGDRQQDEKFDLKQPTEEGLREKQAVLDEAESEHINQDKFAEKEAKKEAEDKQLNEKLKTSSDNFELGQSADDEISGQKSIFSRSERVLNDDIEWQVAVDQREGREIANSIRATIPRMGEQRFTIVEPRKYTSSDHSSTITDNSRRKQKSTTELSKKVAGLEKLLNKRIIFVKPEGDSFNGFAGLFIPVKNSKTLYISVNSKFSIESVVGHEFYEWLQSNNPSLHQWFAEQARHYLKDEPFWNYVDEQNKLGDKQPIYGKYKELLADFTGDAISDPKFRRQLYQSNISKFINWLRGFSKYLKILLDRNNKTIGLLSDKNHNTDSIFNDVEELRKTLLKVIKAAQSNNFIEANNNISFSRSAMKDIDANISRGEKAMNTVLLDRTTVHRAMHRNGMGWVDFEWGDDKKGVAHVIKRRKQVDKMSRDEVIKFLTKDVVSTIANGEELRRSESSHSARVLIAHGDNEVSLVKNTGSNAWMLTAWKRRDAAQGDGGAVYDAATSTHNKPTRSQQAVGASASNSANAELDNRISQATDKSSISFSRQSAFDLSRESFEVSEPGKLDAVIRSMQNNKIDLKRIQDAIRKDGGVINENADAYLNEELYISRLTDSLDRFSERRVIPILEAMNQSDLSIDKVDDYLYARHAVEANEHLEKISQDVDDNKALSGMTNEEAFDIIAKYADNKVMQKIGEMVDELTAETRRRLISTGLEEASTIKQWEKAYKHYVPLQRGGGDSAKRGSGYTVKGKESQRRTGSNKRAENIFINVIRQAESSITRSEKARVGRSLLDLAREHPNDDFWKVDEAPNKKVINKETGLVEVERDPLFKNNDNVLVVKENGKEHWIIFNKNNARAMEIAKAMKNLDAAQLLWMTNAVGKTTRYISQWLTSRQPLFWVTNFARDLQHATFNLSDTPISGKEVQMLKNIPLAMRGYWSITRGKGNGKWAQAAMEFKAAGAETGFSKNFDTPEKHMADIKKQLKQIQQKNTDPRKWARETLKLIDDYNSIVENGVRLAVYQTGRENGMSTRAAASMAKNITVNFNRRGNSTSWLNALYMFSNANIQGHARTFAALKNSKKARVYAGIIVGIGFMLYILNRSLSEDDEKTGRKKYDLIPEWEKQKNWIFFSPSGKYVKIPMAQGLDVLMNVGRMLAESIFSDNKKSALEMSWDIAKLTVDVFNPLGSDDISEMITPTVLRPITQSVLNRSFTGSPLYPEGDKRGYISPAYQRAFRSTSEHWIEASKMINNLTGGDDIVPSKIDIPPEVIKHIITSYLMPGITQNLDRAVGTATRASRGEKIEPSQIPGLSRFYGEAPEERTQMRAYYEESNRITQLKEQYKRLNQAGKTERANEILAELGDGDISKGRKIAGGFTTSERQLSALNKKRKLLENQDDNEALREIDSRRIDVMQRALSNLHKEKELDIGFDDD